MWVNFKTVRKFPVKYIYLLRYCFLFVCVLCLKPFVGSSYQTIETKHSRMAYKEAFFFFFLSFFVFLGPYLRHMEVPKLGVKLELQLPAYATTTATPDLHTAASSTYTTAHCNARSLTHWAVQGSNCILMDISQIHFHWATTGTPQCHLLNILSFSHSDS